MLPARSFGVALSGLSEAAVSSERKAAAASVLHVRTALFWSSWDSHGRLKLTAAAATGSASRAPRRPSRIGDHDAGAGRGSSAAASPSTANPVAPRAGNSQNQ